MEEAMKHNDIIFFFCYKSYNFSVECPGISGGML
jgi:hypothetical protein